MYLCTQGSISGFAIISPWALKKCRAYGTQSSPPQINHTPPRTHSYLTIHAIPISTGYPFKSNNTPILAMSPLGRYLFRAQGASPGLIIGTHLLSPKGAALLTATLNLEALTRKSNKGCRKYCDSPYLYII